MPEILKVEDPFLVKLRSERESAYDYQKRRFEQWRENYTLYRDTVEVNRLTQRQAVNIPLIKETVKTILSSIDEKPDISFQELSNDLEKEYVMNEFWNWDTDRINFEGRDIQDKKNVLLYGRSFMKLNFMDEFFDCEVPDIYDILVDPKTDPLNIDSARFIIHQHIYRPLQVIMGNNKYDKEAKRKLSINMATKQGLLLGSKNTEALEDKRKRFQDIGGEDYSNLEKMIASGDTIVSLTEHFTNEWDEKQKEFIKQVAIVAEDEIILFKKPLNEVLGIDFWPFVSWTSDVDISDFWSDGDIDIIRIINKVINVWFSQMTENRTLKNYGMRYFDAANTKGFSPKSFTPEPWGWYPVPGNPNEIIKEIAISSLEDNLTEIDFLIKMAERATATPSAEKGMAEKRQITLGELQMIVGKAAERTKGMAKFYRRARKEFAEKWLKIIEANIAPSKTVKLYKTSYKGNIFMKDVRASDWKSKVGYRVKVVSSAEQESEDATNVQRLTAIKTQFPDNPVIQKIFMGKLLEIGDLSPEEIKEAKEYENQKLQRMTMPILPQESSQVTPSVSSQDSNLAGKISELKTLASQSI